MYRFLQVSEQKVANGFAVASGGTFGVTFFAGFNEILTAIALIVAIVSGGISIYKSLKKKKDE